MTIERATTVVTKNHIGVRMAVTRLVPACANAAHKIAARHIKISILRVREISLI